MKKALVLSSLGYDTGCALRARYLARALERAGWNTLYVRPPFPSLPASLEIFLSLPWYLWNVLRFRPDLAVGIKPYPDVWLPLFLARLLGGLCVADVDDLDGGYRRGLLALAGRLSQAPAYWLLKVFSTHHPGLRAFLIREKGVPAAHVVWLGQGVDISIFGGGSEPANAAEAGKKILLFAAHMNVACEFPLLLDFLEPLLKKAKNLCLVAAGGGPRLDEFRRLAQSLGLGSKIKFTGPLPPAQVASWMARASVCLAIYGPSLANDFRVPMKVGEYLGMGKPVVTNAIPGLGGLRRFLYLSPLKPRNYRALVEKLVRGKGDKRAARGRAWVRAKMNWDAVAKRFLDEVTRVSHGR